MASKEHLRQLVLDLAKALDASEYRNKTIYTAREIRAAVKALEQTDIKSGLGPEEEKATELANGYLCDQRDRFLFEDIDLSRPDYEGMDDPI